MAFEAKPTTPSQELPTAEMLLTAEARLKPFMKDPIAKIAHTELTHAITLQREELHEIVNSRVEMSGTPAVDLLGLERKVGKFNKNLGDLLTTHGKGDAVAALRKKYGDVRTLSTELVALARTVKGSKALSALADETSDAEQLLVAARKRVSDGGHPIFEGNVAKAATKIWLAYDQALDVIGILLRKAAISYDETYAGRSTIRSSLRPVLLLKDPKIAVPKKKKGPKPPPSSPAGGTKGGSTPS